MSYHHITIYQRFCIRSYLDIEYSIRKIARLVKLSASSVSRELDRNMVDGVYEPIVAERFYLDRRQNSHKIIKLTPEIKQHIEQRIKLTWSPDEIVGRNEPKPSNFPSVSTIYHWIHKSYIVKGGMSKLRRKGKFKRKNKRGTGTFEIGASIRQRPEEVYGRQQVGHWEGDTVVGKHGTTPCFVTLLERKSRYYLAEHMPNRNADTTNKATVSLLGNLPHKAVKTITVDRGNEFARWKEVEKRLDCKIYFADAYCAWQKGSNENTNGLLREFFPKGKDLSDVKPQQLERALRLLNNRPRKCLNYRTPKEVFYEELAKC